MAESDRCAHGGYGNLLGSYFPDHGIAPLRGLGIHGFSGTGKIRIRMIVETSRESKELYGIWDLGVSFMRSIVIIYITVRSTSPFTSD
jgi:hypothetical protein